MQIYPYQIVITPLSGEPAILPDYWQNDQWIDVDDALPPAKEGWTHSEMCVVYYPANDDRGELDGYGIAFYHWKPPFRTEPEWVDWANAGRVPTHWKSLEPPRCEGF